jgi:CBS domain containing-hemolysin-like protein
MDALIPVAVIAGLIFLNGLFVAAEFAIVGAPAMAIERRARGGERLANLVARVLRFPRSQDRYVATAQLGITFASLGLGMYGEHVVAGWLTGVLEALGAARYVAAHVLGSVLAIVGLNYLHIVLGEMVPKSLALMHAERASLLITPAMLVVRALLFPLVVALNSLGNALLGLLGVDRLERSQEHYHTAEELELVIEESLRGGLMRSESARVVSELLEFGDLSAVEVMVPRVDVMGVESGAGTEELAALLREAPHTRYPVYEGDLDHVVGVLHVKDILRLLGEKRPVRPSDVRPVPFVPETARTDAILNAMSEKRAQLAVVLDEFGGTAGVVTTADLFEEIVGDVEEGSAEADIRPQPDGSLLVFGTVRLDELGDWLGLVLEYGEVDTVGGLVLSLLNRPAEPGERLDFSGLELEVTAVDGHRVAECRVRPPGAQ